MIFRAAGRLSLTAVNQMATSLTCSSLAVSWWRRAKWFHATQGAIEQEHRRTRRVPVKSLVMLRFGGQCIEGETVDVSMQGLLVKTQKVLPVGTSVDLSLQLSRTMGPIVGAGSVVCIAGANQMGIHLGRLSTAESQKLQDFLLPLIA